ncbi:MAG: 4Fe-4S binding protein [Dehalococcoidia bacterium]|nr:4Fe-4S binding protein [Dehalococcoidia bacterium]
MPKPLDAREVYARLKERIGEQKLPVDPVYFELAERLLPGDKEIMPRIMARLADSEQARIVAALPDPDQLPVSGRTLGVSDAFAVKLGMDKAVVDRNIRELFEKGLLFPTKKGPAMARTFIQLHDASLGNPNYDEKLGRIYYDLWGYMEGVMEKPTPKDIPTTHNSEFRVVPRWASIKDVPGVQPFEDAHAILKSRDLIALIPCGCKRSHTDRWCGLPEQSCLTLDRTAQYNLDRNIGRKVSVDEAIAVIERFDKLPAVHVTVNQREVAQLLCNCHYCCCMAIKVAQKSRFVSEVDLDKCKGCKACVERCQFQANSMIKYDGIEGEKAYTDPEICRGCGSCNITCKAGARTMKLVCPVEHVPESLSIY